MAHTNRTIFSCRSYPKKVLACLISNVHLHPIIRTDEQSHILRKGWCPLCEIYFRKLKVMVEVGKDIDEAFHLAVNTYYMNCSNTWKART